MVPRLVYVSTFLLIVLAVCWPAATSAQEPTPTATPLLTPAPLPLPTLNITTTQTVTATQTITATLAVTATLPITATGTPVSETSVLFTDLAGKCGLSIVDDANRTYSCDNGEYTMTFKTESRSGWVWYGPQYDDAVIEVDVRPLSGDDVMTGMILRRTSDGAYYAYQVSRGKYFFGLYSNQKWTVLIPWTDSGAIAGGLAVNKLKAVMQGPQITLYVNDQPLQTYEDSTQMRGNVGLIFGNDKANGKAGFANFKISRINQALPVPTAKPTPLPTPTIPPGMGAVVVANFFGQEINFTIGGKMYTVPPNDKTFIFLPPGTYPTSGTMAGTRLQCTSSCSITVEMDKYSVFTFG